MLSLFSVDDHILEHPGVWADRLPAKYREAGPHVSEDAEGNETWVYEDTAQQTVAFAAIAGKPKERWTIHEPARFSEMIPGCYDPAVRAKDLAADGIKGTVCFPTMPGFAGTKFLKSKDFALADLCVQAYNDWLFEEWCAAAPELYVPMIIGQLWDPEKMAAEIRRNAARGARALTFPDSQPTLGLPTWFTNHWDPVWDAIQEAEMVVCLHFGTGGVRQAASPESPFAANIALQPVSSLAAATDLMFCDALDRFPGLKFAMSEGGIGWVPFGLERADGAWERHRRWEGLGDTPPSHRFRDHIFVCFVDEEAGIAMRHHIGIENIMWECDYPHADSPWPHSQKSVERQMEGVPADEVALITHGNAARVFRWPIS